jgi:uncharacterized protein (DUF2235 family)
VYYDPGVGTFPEPGWVTWAGKLISDIAGLAFGAGLTWKIQEAYRYLMHNWEPGDQVFLFGFSRGAYAVRVLAGMLHELGLMPRGNDNMVPYMVRLFKTARKDELTGKSEDKSAYWKLRDEFRRTFARPVNIGDDERRFPIHFVGVWDTVSSIGWAWDPPKFPFSTHNPTIDVIRHAVSVDERRWFFRQNLMEQAEQKVSGARTQDIVQLWFPGVHCDVGGGYPEESSGLWRTSFEWMLAEAQNAGLFVNQTRVADVLRRTTPSQSPWDDPAHESLTPAWWPLEFFPKLCWQQTRQRRFPAVGLGRHRTIAAGQLLSAATIKRIRETDYAPANMTARFRADVRGLSQVPESYPYAP